MMPIAWTESQSLKLVILYSKHECLRNPFHRDFRDKLSRYKAYKQIVDCMNIYGLTIYDCIKRITYLKAQYCYELSKISAAISCEKSYKPRANWFPIMHEILFPFIKTCGCTDDSWKIHDDEKDIFNDYYSKKTNNYLTFSNAVELKEIPYRDCSCPYTNCCCASYRAKFHMRSTKPIEAEAEAEAEGNKIKNLVATNYMHLQETLIDVGSNTEECITVAHEIQTDASCFKTEQKDNTVVKSDSNDTAIEEDNKEKRKNYDEFDMFGKSIASQLRNINFEVAIKLEKRIQDLIVQERLDNINSKYVSHTVCANYCTPSCSDCKIMHEKMICSCGLPVIMIKTDQSCQFDYK